MDGIVKRVAVAVFLLAPIGVAACGEDDRVADPPKQSPQPVTEPTATDAERLVDAPRTRTTTTELVRRWSELPPKEQRAAVVEWVEGLWFTVDEYVPRGFSRVLDELLFQGLWDAVADLDQHLWAESLRLREDAFDECSVMYDRMRDLLHRRVARNARPVHAGTPHHAGALKLAQVLAARHPHDIFLAPYGRDAMEFLLRVVEDPEVDVSRRVGALRHLETHGTAVHLPRLAKLQHDMTPVPDLDNLPRGEKESDMANLGDYVRRCIERIKQGTK